MDKYIGVDVGGTSIKAGIIDDNGNILARTEENIYSDNKMRAPIIDIVMSCIDQLFLNHNIAGIGVSTSGQIDKDNSIIPGTCDLLPGWGGTKIGEKLSQRYDVPVSIANDGDCMCMAEAWVGNGKGCSNLIGITIGTGIGGGIISGGHLIKGAGNLSCEIGYIKTHHTNGNLNDCWESYASTSALVRMARAYMPEIRDGKEIFNLARRGDAQILEMMDSWTDEIAIGICDLVHIFNPEKVLIGGGVSSQQELLIDPLEKKVRENVLPIYAANLQIKASLLKNDAGMTGAVYYLRKISKENDE